MKEIKHLNPNPTLTLICQNIANKYQEKRKCILGQGRTGIKNRPGQFPDDLSPYRPSPDKIVNNSEITIFHVKMTVFYLHPSGPPALPKCKHGQSASGQTVRIYTWCYFTNWCIFISLFYATEVVNVVIMRCSIVRLIGANVFLTGPLNCGTFSLSSFLLKPRDLAAP